MKVSLNWLCDFVDIKDLSPDFLAEKLILRGIEVESWFEVGKFAEQYKIVEVVDIRRVEGVRLPVCTIYDGQSKYQVVSGAPNIKKGKFVYAPPGSKVVKNGDVVELGIKKIKNVESFGMLLSPVEIGFPGGEEDKLMEVDESVEVGENFAKVFGLPDIVFDLSITPQRGDLLSIFGVATEVSAIFKREMRKIFPEDLFYDIRQALSFFENEFKGIPRKGFQLKVENERCPLYIGILFSGVLKSRISPPKIVSRLYICGARPLNPIVDITNYIMFEFGQPTHAFDFDKIKDGIVVRLAEDGENLLCLDGKERTLSQDDLIIADFEKPIAIAGAVGGENTAIDDETKSVLLESAFFLPSSVRRTSKRHNIETESAYRFARRVPPPFVLLAPLKIKELFQNLGLYPQGFDFFANLDYFEQRKIEFDINFVNDYTGTNLKEDQIIEAVKSLGIKVEGKVGTKIFCIPPISRGDLKIKEDIVEEVLRFHGYEIVPSSYPYIPSFFVESFDGVKRRILKERVKDFLVSVGFSEVKTYPFSQRGHLKMRNPIDKNLPYLSSNLREKILDVILSNLKKGWGNVRVFEIDKVFPGAEKESLCFGATGKAYPELWNSEKRKIDIFDIKGIVETLFRDNVSFLPKKSDDILSYSFSILHKEKEVGIIGAFLEKKLGYEIFICEIDFDSFSYEDFFDLKTGSFYSDLPLLQRDLSFFVPEGMMWADIKQAFFVENVIDAFVFDVWQEGKKKSYAVRFIIRQPKLLNSDEVNIIIEKIISNLEKLGAEVRAAK
jgi:phenylalanyl-tRNA synthetase beta chain